MSPMSRVDGVENGERMWKHSSKVGECKVPNYIIKVSYDYQKKEYTRDEWTLSPISIIVPSNLVLARNLLTRQYKSHCCHDMVLCHRAL